MKTPEKELREEQQRMYPDKKIVVHVEGGVIQKIEDIPEGVEIEVRDYDTDGLEADRLTETPDGEAAVSIWNSDGYSHALIAAGRSFA